MKRKIISYSIALMTASLLFQQCNKKEEKTAEPDLTYSKTTTNETSSATNEFEDIGRLTDNALNAESANMRVDATSSCWDSIYHDKVNHRITLVFKGSTCSDGRTRRGKILIDYLPGKRYIEQGFKSTTTLSDYSVDGIKIEGTRIIENLGYNNSNNLVYKVAETNGKITYTDNSTITWVSERTREWKNFKGSELDFSNDEWIISGNAQGKKLDGKNYSLNFDKITYKATCIFANITVPGSGIETIVIPEGTLKINFGPGSCDKNVVITYFNGKDYDYTLK